jgi:hypothetical protein
MRSKARHQGAIMVSAEAVEGAVLVRWEDDGVGIAADQLAQVFDPFYTTQLGQTGMGLGLASVHSMIVNLMRGEVTLESTPATVRACCCACQYKEVRQDAIEATTGVDDVVRAAGHGRAEPLLMVGDMAPYSMASGRSDRVPWWKSRKRWRSAWACRWSAVLSVVAGAGHGLAGAAHLVLPLTRTAERENKYRWLLKLYRQTFIFVGLHGNPQLSDPARLLHARLVVLRGTPYKQLLDAGYTDIAECATIRECIRMVKTGIADASFGAEDTHRSAASMNGNKPPSSATAPCSAKRRLAGRLARLHRRRRANGAPPWKPCAPTAPSAASCTNTPRWKLGWLARRLDCIHRFVLLPPAGYRSWSPTRDKWQCRCWRQNAARTHRCCMDRQQAGELCSHRRAFGRIGAQHHGKFVAAQPGRQVRLSKLRRQPGRDLMSNLSPMTIRIVNRLNYSVQIQHGQRRLPTLGGSKMWFKKRVEHHAVSKARQRVVGGLMLCRCRHLRRPDERLADRISFPHTKRNSTNRQIGAQRQRRFDQAMHGTVDGRAHLPCEQ